MENFLMVPGTLGDRFAEPVPAVPGTIHGQQGMTLSELMMSVAVSVIITYVVFTAIRVMTDQNNTSGLKMAIQTSAREVLYKMLMEIRESSPSRITITGGDTIQFQIPNQTTPVTSGYAVNWGDTIRYARGGTNNRQIIRTNVTTSTTSVIGNDVTSMAVTGNTTPPTKITITINVQRSLLNGRAIPSSPIPLTGQARVRNSS